MCTESNFQIFLVIDPLGLVSSALDATLGLSTLRKSFLGRNEARRREQT